MKKLAYLLPFLFLGACGKQQTAPQQTSIQDVPVQLETAGEADPSAVDGAKRGGTFSTWAGEFPKSLNMWLDNNTFSAQISQLMFEPLFEMHSTDDKPAGRLAESWDISPDNKVFTFKIDPNAKWSDGQPVTAEDVQFYYDVIMNPKNLTSATRVIVERFSRPEVLDEHTVRITATDPSWKSFWDAGSFFALPKHAWKDVDFNQQNFKFPVVSGPYAIDEVNMDRSIKLKRRGDWWGRAQRYQQNKFNFDYLVFKAEEDRTKALELLKKGEFDLYRLYTAKIWVEDTHFPQVDKNWVVRQQVYNRYPVSFQGFAMNLRRPIFQDLKVRQALAYLLDRELMNDKLMFNQYFLLNSYFPQIYPNNVNPDVPVTKYDPDKARELLKEAGWQVGSDGILAKDGQQLSITIMHSEGSDLRHLDIYVQDMLKVGIKANLDIVSQATWTDRIDHHNFDMVWAAWGASRLIDPEGMWSSKQADEISSDNWPGYKNPEVDKLIEQQKTEMDFAKRTEIIKKMDAILVADVPYVLMWENDNAKLLYWNRFGTPKYILSKFGDESDAQEYWWFDPAKSQGLDAAEGSNTSLPKEPEDIHYPE